MTYFRSVLVAALLMATPLVAAQAAPPCSKYGELVKLLLERHGEEPISRAMTSIGWVAETFVNLETGTWSRVLTAPNGLACLTETGNSFMPMTVSMPGRVS